MALDNITTAIRRDVARLIEPPRQESVSEAARKWVKLRAPSGGATAWDGDFTPYMCEPMDLLSSREYEAVIFVGPAQSGKTQALVDCWVGWMAMVDPSDMMILQTSQDTARDFSRRRIDRLHRYSPAIQRQTSNSPQGDNTYDKVYRAGNILTIGWPSINQLSGKPIKFLALTDYDRMPESVDGEGSPFNLAAKRATTFLSRGMTMAESSPGHEVLDPQWKPRGIHEAPPTRGILSLFNLGDRRRWYWPCQHCGEFFMQAPGIEGFSFEMQKDKYGITKNTTQNIGVSCPKCGVLHGRRDKRAMIDAGEWRAEPGREPSRIASFWLPGAAASYVTWRQIVKKYLDAMREQEITGSEESLRNVTNLDLGAPYTPVHMQSDADPAAFQRRAEDVQKRAIPEGARFLVASVDVQKARFVVQVHGYGPGLECWIIDRFDLLLSPGRGEKVAIDPAARIEDWAVLRDQVFSLRYPLSDGSGRSMAVMVTSCDSGGAAGVTERAYDFWRRCRSAGLHRRLMLVKGERPSPGARRARVQQSYPDTTHRAQRKSGASGDVPVYLLNTTALKDGIHNDLSRDATGPGYVHFPDWLPPTFYEELTAESRGPKGWDLMRRDRRNEALDLMVYAKAACIAIGAEKIDWDRPPAWAREWDRSAGVDGGEGEALPGLQQEPRAPKPKPMRRGFVNRWR